MAYYSDEDEDYDEDEAAYIYSTFTHMATHTRLPSYTTMGYDFEEMLCFRNMDAREMANWAHYHTDEINKHDGPGSTILQAAAYSDDIHSGFVARLIDVYHADIEKEATFGGRALGFSKDVEVLELLLDRGATVGVDSRGWTPLMVLTMRGQVECVKRLLEEPEVHKWLDVQSPPDDAERPESAGFTVLHLACGTDLIPKCCELRRELVEAVCLNAVLDPLVRATSGETPGEILRRNRGVTSSPTPLDGLEEKMLEAYRVYLLSKVRGINESCHAVAETRKKVGEEGGRTEGEIKQLVVGKMPPYLKERVEKGSPPLPCVCVEGRQSSVGGKDEDGKEEEEKAREKFLAVYDYVVQGEGRVGKEGGGRGSGGAAAVVPAAASLPPDVFVDLMVMLSEWYPARGGGREDI